jgi:hypothetical protein
MIALQEQAIEWIRQSTLSASLKEAVIALVPAIPTTLAGMPYCPACESVICGACGHCDTPPRLKARGFFCLSSVRDTMRSGAWLRLGAHRSGGGKAERAPPFRRVLSWAVPCLLVFPCLSQRDEWPTTSVSGVLGRTNTRVFRRCSPGNAPQGRRLFLERVCLGCHTRL